MQPGLVGTKLLALKFLETHVLLFTSDSNDFENFTKEGIAFLFVMAIYLKYFWVMELPLLFNLYTIWFVFNSLDTVLTLSTIGSKQTFNISWLSGGHPFLDPVSLTSEANRMLGTLMDLLQSACNLPGSVIITVVNWWVFSYHLSIIIVYSFTDFCQFYLLISHFAWSSGQLVPHSPSSVSNVCNLG